MQYTKPYILTEKLWNNAFAWEERIAKYNKNPSLIIPSCITGDIWDVQIGEEIVFEEMEDGILKSCRWLKNFVRIIPENVKNIPKWFSAWVFWESVSEDFRKKFQTVWAIASFWNLENWTENRFQNDSEEIKTFDTFGHKSIRKTPEIVIFDNHNHALYFWCEAIQRWILESHFELIHIDEHSDLWENKNELNRDQSITDLKYTWNFTNFSCNVGNYIQPALKCWLIKNMIRIENEYQIDAYLNQIPDTNSILNIDLDIFAPELDHIPEDKKIQIIRNLIQKVKYVTIATSPYFIEQWKALQMLEKILQKQE
jgi:hypothetical protein